MRPLSLLLVSQRMPIRPRTRVVRPRTFSVIGSCRPFGGQTRYIASAKENGQFVPSRKNDIKVGGVVSFRLMPLGGSVTQGVGSSTGAGYRRPLLGMLQKHDFYVQMVGSRKSGSISNKNHEGWPGLRIDEIHQKAQLSVPQVLPDVFAVNAGSNDCLQSFKLEDSGNRLDYLLEYLWQTSPGATIILSTLIVSADEQTNKNVNFVNDQYRTLAKKKANEQKKIVLVDMNCEMGPQVDCLVDGIHPDDDGYEKMARLWLNGFMEALQKGFLAKLTE